MQNHLITKCEIDKWESAQEFEKRFASEALLTKDDWNHWWAEKFNSYSYFKGKSFEKILEVGCGPHTNVRLLLPILNVKHVYLEDPLLAVYINEKVLLSSFFGKLKFIYNSFFSEKWRNFTADVIKDDKLKVDYSSHLLEDLPYKNEMMDVVICINVLDHVNDASICISEMKRVLKKGGYLIIGQDLSNEEDMKNCPESYEDFGHPIKVNHIFLDQEFKEYKVVLRNIISREDGRNPKAHYGTYISILSKP